MAGSPMLKRMLETGTQFSEMSQKNAEKIVADFVKAGELRRKDAERTVQQLVERGRSTTEHFLGLIQAEVSKQLGRFAQRLDDVEARMEDVAGSFGVASMRSARKAANMAGAPARTTGSGTMSSANADIVVENTAVKKAPASRSGSTAKRSASAAKKGAAVAKRGASAAKKGASAAKKAAAKKAPARKASAKKATAKKAPAKQ